MNKPNKKYDYVYVVLRYDTGMDTTSNAVSVVKVFSCQSDTEREVERLNHLAQRSAQHKGSDRITSIYFWHFGRMPKGILQRQD